MNVYQFMVVLLWVAKVVVDYHPSARRHRPNAERNIWNVILFEFFFTDHEDLFHTLVVDEYRVVFSLVFDTTNLEPPTSATTSVTVLTGCSDVKLVVVFAFTHHCRMSDHVSASVKTSVRIDLAFLVMELGLFENVLDHLDGCALLDELLDGICDLLMETRHVALRNALPNESFEF